MFGKQTFACHAETMRLREDSDLRALPSSPLAHHAYLILFVVITGDNSLPGPGPLSKFFQAAKGELKSSS